MKNLRTIFGISLMILFLFSSCTKENISIEKTYNLVTISKMVEENDNFKEIQQLHLSSIEESISNESSEILPSRKLFKLSTQLFNDIPVLSELDKMSLEKVFLDANIVKSSTSRSPCSECVAALRRNLQETLLFLIASVGNPSDYNSYNKWVAAYNEKVVAVYNGALLFNYYLDVAACPCG